MIGKIIILSGIIITIVGILIYLMEKTGLPSIPGNFYYKKGDFSFYFPLTYLVIASIIISVIIYIITRIL
jgi:hypothetical protein